MGDLAQRKVLRERRLQRRPWLRKFDKSRRLFSQQHIAAIEAPRLSNDLEGAPGGPIEAHAHPKACEHVTNAHLVAIVRRQPPLHRLPFHHRFECLRLAHGVKRVAHAAGGLELGGAAAVEACGGLGEQRAEALHLARLRLH